MDKHYIQNKVNENNPKFYSNEIILFQYDPTQDKKSIKKRNNFHHYKY